MRRLRPLAAVLLMLASCKGCDEPSKPAADAAAAPAEAAAPVATASAKVIDASSPAGPTDASSSSSSDAAVIGDEPFGDAGTSSCRLVYGPAEQPFRGPAALAVVSRPAFGGSATTTDKSHDGQELRLVANDMGKPRVFPVVIPPIPPKGAPSIVPPRPSTFTGMRWPPCELAGRFAYCQAPGGAVVRSIVGSTEAGKTVAKSKSGTRIAGASLGSPAARADEKDHSVVAFLDTRHTTEGDMLQAFVALDEREPVRLSEDGAGATTIRFLPRGETPVAVYLDTRTSMVPVHARPMSLKGSDLALAPDVVVSVGGVPERGIDFAVAPIGTKGFAFVPMPRETVEFGMAALLIDDPPKEDVGAVWSGYPNGLDPSPVGAAGARDGKSAWVARLRPREKAVGSPRILELGRVDATGNFSSYGEIAPGPGRAPTSLSVTDISLIEDGSGAVWILYGDTSVTWLERRICP